MRTRAFFSDSMHRATALAIAILLGIFATPVSVYAGDGMGDAGQPGEYLYYGTSVRSLAMGRTYVGLADDAAAVFHNPAGLMNVSRLWNGYLMHFDPFDGSRYNVFAVTYAGPDTLLPGYRGFLFGPNSAWGIGGVYLRSDDYQYRTDNDIYEGDFGLYQQAWFASFAHRQVISIGDGDFAVKLDAGAGFKITRQGFFGLRTYESDYGSGLDIGVQLQFIHPWPISSYLPLRVLLPLRIGASVQNSLLRPQAGFGGKSDRFPTIYRLGFSYAIVASPLTRILVAGDAAKQEWNCRSWGYHLGTELTRDFRITDKDTAAVSLRAGGYYQSQQWRPTVGIGFAFDITDKLAVEVDYAHEFHTALQDDFDQRFALKLAYGISRGADMYKRFADDSLGNPRERYYHALEAMACYPYMDDEIRTPACLLTPVGKAAGLLGSRLDTVRHERYAQFIGRGYYADQLVYSARALLRTGDIDGARAKARKAISLAEEIADCPGGYGGLMLAEAYMILAVTEPGHASQHARDALNWLAGKIEGDFAHYLAGRCYQLIGGEHNIDSALAEFGKIREDADDKLDIHRLSLIQSAACLSESSHTDAKARSEMIERLRERILEHERELLSDDYVPYPPHADTCVADDAQYYIGSLNDRLGKTEEAKAAYAKVCRFYPDKSRCRDGTAEERLETLIEHR